MLLSVIRHCITDIWNLLTHLQIQVNAATLEASYTWREGGGSVEWRGLEGWGGVASTHLATCFGYALKASNISQLKEFAGEVFNMAGSICYRLCVLLVCLWAADQTHQCHHGLSWGTITSWNNTNSRVQRPDMKRWHAYQEFWMRFFFCFFLCACVRVSVCVPH